jgi:hydroxymethylglutaryl-CoA reductase (NADPH)
VKIPSFVLKKLYVRGSLRAEPRGLRFTLRNTLASASLTGVRRLTVAGQDVPAERVRVRVGAAEVDLASVSPELPFVFPRNGEAEVLVLGPPPDGRVKVRLEADSAEFGELLIEFEDESS